MIKRNGFLYLVVFFFLLSVMANIYSFNKLSEGDNEHINRIKELINENNELKEQRQSDNNIDEDKEDNNTKKESNKINNESKKRENRTQLEEENNTIEKFIEYTFNTDSDSYTTRKKLAKEYMTDELFDTYFSSDSVDSDEMKLLIEVKEVEVFHGYNNDKAIVRYVIEETKAQGDYHDEIEKYANIELKKGKVSKIKSLSNNEWGV